MKILLLTQLFQPEPNHLKGIEFARRLQGMGHEVRVLTGFPNYPDGKLYPGYRMRLMQREELDGVKITRVAMFPSHDSSAIRRILTYLSFAFTASILGPFLFHDADVVHVYQGPATLMIPGALIRWTSKARVVLDVQDLWPESVLSSQMMNNRFLARILHWFVGLSYRPAHRIVVLSEGYRRVLIERGVPAGKIDVVYNWCDERQVVAAGTSLPELDEIRLQGKKLVLYAGSMGPVQSLGHVLDAAGLLRDRHQDIQFVFVGSGIECDTLRRRVETEGLRNVTFLPHQPASRMSSVLQAADVLLVHLRRDFLCSVGIPQKTQLYLATGRPILMAVDGEAADVIRIARAGYACHPENAQEIAEAVVALFSRSPEEREAMGCAGRDFYQRKMSFSIGTERIAFIYEHCC
jgi:colanic acid biosynthesis glycosyl transferase WcaI